MSHRKKIADKIVAANEAVQMVKAWKAAGLKVAFTNGCFDLLHYGHVDYLSRAADLADRLVVGLNTDASVGRLKGPHRPIQSEASRALVMAGLGFVDVVVFFDEQTPLKLISALLPDVLVKGADYSVDDIVGAKEVLASGGCVKTISLSEGYSTSAIEHRILSSK
ncbi:MAG: D-glycero-beta-D-manno-heptose 1-phosphate adenylyltransferase [Bacteroidia bacterium]